MTMARSIFTTAGLAKSVTYAATLPDARASAIAASSDQHVAGEVQEHDAVLHLSDSVGVDHALGGVHGWYVDGDEVALLEHLRQVGELHCRGNLLVHGDLVHGRIVADDLHAQRLGGLGHELANGPQAYDAQRLAKDLAAGELLFGLLGSLAHVLVVGVVAHPRPRRR